MQFGVFAHKTVHSSSTVELQSCRCKRWCQRLRNTSVCICTTLFHTSLPVRVLSIIRPPDQPVHPQTSWQRAQARNEWHVHVSESRTPCLAAASILLKARLVSGWSNHQRLYASKAASRSNQPVIGYSPSIQNVLLNYKSQIILTKEQASFSKPASQWPLSHGSPPGDAREGSRLELIEVRERLSSSRLVDVYLWRVADHLLFEGERHSQQIFAQRWQWPIKADERVRQCRNGSGHHVWPVLRRTWCLAIEDWGNICSDRITGGERASKRPAFT